VLNPESDKLPITCVFELVGWHDDRHFVTTYWNVKRINQLVIDIHAYQLIFV